MRTIQWSLSILVFIVFMGCAKKEKSPPRGKASKSSIEACDLAALESLPFGKGSAAINLPSARLKGKVLISKEFDLDREYEIEFIPVNESSNAGGAKLKTAIIADGAETALAVTDTLSTGTQELEG
ncbi:hypothetical protein HY256_09660, partial [Candidatus Sumerlaeota bacterium]|nr:hypothetical protein [Candidatus Sumerlaeota bacterium]